MVQFLVQQYIAVPILSVTTILRVGKNTNVVTGDTGKLIKLLESRFIGTKEKAECMFIIKQLYNFFLYLLHFDPFSSAILHFSKKLFLHPFFFLSFHFFF